MNAGINHLERCLLGSNRSGKSETCAFEVYLHATGNYNDHPWFKGMKFNPAEDIEIWIVGVSHELVKTVLQTKLLGSHHAIGTGLIPKTAILDMKTKAGVPNAVSDVIVMRAGGGKATISFKSYVQGREAFQGAAVHFIGLDEECPGEIYEECVTRCATVNGRIALYFTPLSGITDTVMHFLPKGKVPEDHEVPGRSAYVDQITWDDVPLALLPQAMRDELEATFLPHQREARMRGIPVVSEGKVYTVTEQSFVVAPFQIPTTWPKYYAFDIGYRCSCALWFAHDTNSDTLYVYNEYYAETELPSTHVAAIKSKGDWIPGVIDPASLQTTKHDGLSSFSLYKDMGLDIRLADNRVATGIMAVTNRLTEGRLKVFSSCMNVLEEYRLYRYSTSKTTGEVRVAKKQRDHAMDALRYGVMASEIGEVFKDPDDDYRHKARNRMGRNPTTGY